METLNSKQLGEKWLEYQRLRHNNPELFGLKSTGLKTLDEIIGGGIELGQLVYIGGAQKSGKTTLLLRIAKSFAMQKVRSIWFGAEMNNMQIGSMLFSNITKIERTKIRSIKLESEDWPKLEKAATEIAKYPTFWNYGFSTIDNIDKIIDKIEEQIENNIEAIFIDYIQLMEAPGIKGGRAPELESISRALKRRSISREKPMAIIAAAQLNRESIRAKIVDANAFLGTGAIERDMDIGVIITNAPDPTTGDAMPNARKVVVVGSRESAIGEKTIYYNGSTAMFEDGTTTEVDIDKYWREQH